MAGHLEIMLWVCAGVWGLFFLQLLVNRFSLVRLDRLPLPDGDEWPRVSIVVPARNEERAIEAAVLSFCRQDYPDLEVIVVDDESSDRTPELLSKIARDSDRLRVIRGTPPPEGWLGKPWALEQGREAATGDWLLFVDADIRFDPTLVRRAVAYSVERDVSMLFLLPDMETGSVGEAVVMSALYQVGASMAPMWLADRASARWIAAGGGVFNLVKKTAVEESGAFESLKDAVVDDVALGFRVKRAGHLQALGQAGRLIGVRMYHGLGETIRGFQKNLYPAIRRFPWLVPLIFAAGAFLNFLPWAGLVLCAFGTELLLPALAAAVASITVPAGIALFYRQPWYITFSGPLKELLCWWILLRSMASYFRRGIVWRERTYGAMKRRGT